MSGVTCRKEACLIHHAYFMAMFCVPDRLGARESCRYTRCWEDLVLKCLVSGLKTRVNVLRVSGGWVRVLGI